MIDTLCMTLQEFYENREKWELVESARTMREKYRESKKQDAG